jgi:hypothetical protein
MVRQKITGSDKPSPGLGDKTLRKTLTPLFDARRNGEFKSRIEVSGRNVA